MVPATSFTPSALSAEHRKTALVLLRGERAASVAGGEDLLCAFAGGEGIPAGHSRLGSNGAGKQEHRGHCCK